MAYIEWLDKDWLEVILKNNQDSRKLNKVITAKFSTATNVGDNYTSKMLRTNILAMSGSGKSISKNIIIKKKKPLQKAELLQLVNNVFSTEKIVYEKVLDKYNEMTRGTVLFNQVMWAQCCYSSLDAVILEDLKESGYKIGDRKVGLDLSHGLLLMSSLGRLHGLSVVAIERRIVNPNILRPYGFLQESCSEFYYSTFTALSNAIKNSWGPEWIEIGEKVHEFGKTTQDKLVRREETSSFKVICHGDCWVNNQMFKYDHLGNPVHVKFVDFQVSHYGSFAWDINYFFHSSIRRPIREPNYIALLTRYRDAMEETFTILGHDGQVPSVQTVSDECFRLRVFGFVTDAIITPIIMCEQEDVVELEDLFSKPDMSERIFANIKYQEYMKPALKQYIKDGIL